MALNFTQNKTAAKPAENPTPTPPPITQAEAPKSTPGYTFDEGAFKSALEKHENWLESFAGKRNHNPYPRISIEVKPLVDRFVNGERTKELFDSALALKQDNPPIISESHPPIEEPKAQPKVGMGGLKGMARKAS